jgi:hypothetical protein
MNEQLEALNRFLADNPELEELSARLARFNIFHALKIEGVEIRHSNTLAWLLDPSESHGMGDVFLRRILSNILLVSDRDDLPLTPAQVELMRLTDVEVRREWKNLDLLAIDHSNRFVIVIENKVWSTEGPGQLTRYLQRVAEDFPGYSTVCVYLTVEGEPSFEESTTFISYSHAQLLWVLERVAKQRQSQMRDDVKVFVSHYMETLRRLTMQDKALVELCQKIYRTHKKAIDLIVEYAPSNFGQVISDVLKQDGEYHVLWQNPKSFWFLPSSWTKVVPHNATAWGFDPPYSVACWFGKNEGRLRLIFEVCQMDDPDLRMQCVEELRKAGFKLGDKAFRKDAKYSRFFTQSESLSGDGDDEEIKAAAEKLIKTAKTTFSKAEQVFRKVFPK